MAQPTSSDENVIELEIHATDIIQKIIVWTRWNRNQMGALKWWSLEIVSVGGVDQACPVGWTGDVDSQVVVGGHGCVMHQALHVWFFSQVYSRSRMLLTEVCRQDIVQKTKYWSPWPKVLGGAFHIGRARKKCNITAMHWWARRKERVQGSKGLMCIKKMV